LEWLFLERFEHGGDIYSHKNISLDYSVNLNPFGMPPEVKNAIISHIDEFASYPDTQCRTLRGAIAEKEGVLRENVLCGNGAADLIYRLCLSYKPKCVLTIAPSFSEYERAARVCESQVVYHKLDENEGFFLTERVLSAITRDIKMFFLCNPNNPTGKLINMSLLNKIAQRCVETGTLLVLDECFLPFTDSESLLSLIKEIPNLVILKAFTKIYAMAGLRLGYLLSGNQEVIRAAEKNAPCWSVSSVAQTAGIAALQCEGWEEKTRQILTQERAYLSDALKKFGLTVYESDCNFLLVKSDRSLYEPLSKKGILIRRCENFVGLDAQFYRLGVKLHPQNEVLIRTLMEVLYG
jgi:threonine-phosphate decarboxylase